MRDLSGQASILRKTLLLTVVSAMLFGASTAFAWTLDTNDHVLVLGEYEDYDYYFEFGGPAGEYLGREPAPVTMPRTLATNGEYVYVGDYASADVLRYTLDGNYLGVFIDDTSAHTLGRLRHIAFDKDGNLYASPAGMGSAPRRISKYDQNGDWVRDYQHADLLFPAGVAVAADGTLYVGQATGWEHAIYMFAGDGTNEGRFDAEYPADLDIDCEAGILFEASHYGTSIQEYALDGTYLGSIPLPAAISYGSGMYYDPFTDHIFTVGRSSDNACLIDLDGTLFRPIFSGGGMEDPHDIIAGIPEPATLLLLALGGPLVARRRH